MYMGEYSYSYISPHFNLLIILRIHIFHLQMCDLCWNRDYTKWSSWIRNSPVFSFAVSSIRCVKPLLLNTPKITSYPGNALRISAAPSTFFSTQNTPARPPAVHGVYHGVYHGIYILLQISAYFDGLWPLHQFLYLHQNRSASKSRYGTA